MAVMQQNPFEISRFVLSLQNLTREPCSKDGVAMATTMVRLNIVSSLSEERLCVFFCVVVSDFV